MEQILLMLRHERQAVKAARAAEALSAHAMAVGVPAASASPSGQAYSGVSNQQPYGSRVVEPAEAGGTHGASNRSARFENTFIGRWEVP